MIITLCGSTRFEGAWHVWNEQLTLEGHTVFSLAVFPSTKGTREWYSEDVKRALDAAHLRKIDASDAIVVITRPVGEDTAYIGDSTSREVAYAKETGRRIFFDYDLAEGKQI